MAMLAFSHFEKFKNQFQLIRHLIHDMTLVGIVTLWPLLIMIVTLLPCVYPGALPTQVALSSQDPEDAVS
jgi:hypothetical protein